MEKPKTAENILRGKYGVSREHGEYRHFFDPIPDMKIILKAMEEYAEQARNEGRKEAEGILLSLMQNEVEQARREEREKAFSALDDAERRHQDEIRKVRATAHGNGVREERNKHESMAAILMGLLENEDVPEDGKYMIKGALAAAGYGKEEQQ